MTPPNLAFCRTLVDEWVLAGLTDAVVAPGSRSAPLAVAVAERLRTSVILDERVAAFNALGIGLATGRPAVLVCTSGTAAAEFHAAVVEASQACVPLIVCTADRPPELQGVGAPQTIDQIDLYGSAPRWFDSPGPAEVRGAHTWRPLAARAVLEATGGAPGRAPGPVHLNLMFREPLLDDPGTMLPPVHRSDQASERPGSTAPPEVPDEVRSLCAGAHRPLVVSGHLGSAGLTSAGVPVFGDHRGPLTGNIPHWDLLVRNPIFRERHRPDLIIRNGMPAASKALSQWLASLDVPQIQIAPPGRVVDPTASATAFLDTPTSLHVSGDPDWSESWTTAGATARGVVDDILASHSEVTEPGVVRHTFATRRPESTVVVSSSMPIRDLETFAHPRADIRVLANRGANGIDGVVSTALGVASTGTPTTLVIGDLAVLHDVGALTGIIGRGVDLTIVVIDNAGGGIFSFLAQHDVLEHRRFEQLFGTPQPVDLAALFALHRIPVTEVAASDELTAAFEHTNGRSDVRAVIARTNREANLVLHDEIAAAVAEAVE